MISSDYPTDHFIYAIWYEPKWVIDVAKRYSNYTFPIKHCSKTKDLFYISRIQHRKKEIIVIYNDFREATAKLITKRP